MVNPEFSIVVPFCREGRVARRDRNTRGLNVVATFYFVSLVVVNVSYLSWMEMCVRYSSCFKNEKKKNNLTQPLM